MARDPKKHHPGRPVASREELEVLLLAGLKGEDPRAMMDEDWERLRRRALAAAAASDDG